MMTRSLDYSELKDAARLLADISVFQSRKRKDITADPRTEPTPFSEEWLEMQQQNFAGKESDRSVATTPSSPGRAATHAIVTVGNVIGGDSPVSGDTPPSRSFPQITIRDAAAFEVPPTAKLARSLDVPQRGSGTVEALEPRQSPESVSQFRGDRLDNMLQDMCERGSFSGAIIADRSGLLLAATQTPVESARVAAFTAIIAETLSQAAHLLEGLKPNNMALDVNYVDKVVIHQFESGGNDFFLLVFCSQDIDARSDIEISLKALASELA